MREKIAEGGVIIADNAMESGIQDFEQITEIVEGESPADVDAETRGIADYLLEVRDGEEFETSVIPLGEGIAVSYRQ